MDLLTNENKIICGWIKPDGTKMTGGNEGHGDIYPWNPLDNHSSFEEWISYLENVWDAYPSKKRIENGWIFIWQIVE